MNIEKEKRQTMIDKFQMKFSQLRIIRVFGLCFLLPCTLHFTHYTCFAVKIHPDAGTTSATFLKIGVGARPTAMAGAFSAVSDDVNALYWNPAGLTQVANKEITAMHNEWFENIRYEFLGYVHPFTRSTSHVKRAFGLSLFGLHMKNDLERRSAEREGIVGDEPDKDLLTVPEGTFGAYDLAGMLSYAQKLSKNLGLGINLKMIKQKIDTEQAYGLGVDIGTLYTLNIKYFPHYKYQEMYDEDLQSYVSSLHTMYDTIQFAAVVQNLGSKVKFIEKGYSLPLNFKLGIAWRRFNQNLTFALDVAQPIDNYLNLSFGMECWLFKMFALRAGYKYRLHGNELSDLAGVSGGTGLRFRNFQLDYAFVPYGVLGDTHRVSFLVRFGKNAKTQKEALSRKKGINPNKVKTVKFMPKTISARESVSDAIVELDDQNLQEVNFRTNRRSADGIEFLITPLREKRVVGPLPSGEIHCIFGIKNNLTSNERATAKLIFKVSKDWVGSNSIDLSSVVLNIYQKKVWKELPTKLIGEQEDSYFYSTELKNNSLYAITGKKRAE